MPNKNVATVQIANLSGVQTGVWVQTPTLLPFSVSLDITGTVNAVVEGTVEPNADDVAPAIVANLGTATADILLSIVDRLSFIRVRADTGSTGTCVAKMLVGLYQ